MCLCNKQTFEYGSLYTVPNRSGQPSFMYAQATAAWPQKLVLIYGSSWLLAIMFQSAMKWTTFADMAVTSQLSSGNFADMAVPSQLLSGESLLSRLWYPGSKVLQQLSIF